MSTIQSTLVPKELRYEPTPDGMATVSLYALKAALAWLERLVGR